MNTIKKTTTILLILSILLANRLLRYELHCLRSLISQGMTQLEESPVTLSVLHGSMSRSSR